MTYAASEEALEEAVRDPRHLLVRADIADGAAMRQVFATHQPDAVMHLAAESHVDRSIDGPADFIQTNLVGTFVLLEAARAYWSGLEPARRAAFRFHHISTDEVFGALGPDGKEWFTEQHSIYRDDWNLAYDVSLVVSVTPSGELGLHPLLDGGRAGEITPGLDGNLWIADLYNFWLQHFTPEGDFLGVVDTFGANEEFNPFAVATDSAGHVFVADILGGTGDRILVLDHA